MAATLAKVLIGVGVLTGVVFAVKRPRRAGAAPLPSATNPPIGTTGVARPTTVGRLLIPALVLIPRDPSQVDRATAITTAVLDDAPVDQNGNLISPQAFVDDLAAALAAAGIDFRTPENAVEVTEALSQIIQDDRILDMPVLEDNPHLATPLEASTTGVILVPGPESGTDRTQIIFPLSGGWPDVTEFPNGTQISLTGAGFVATLPA